jgi:NADH-quinone oxidoreductase subunit L
MFALETLIWLVPALPLAAALVTAALGKKVLREHSHWPTLIALVASFALSLGVLFQVDRRAKHEQQEDVAQGRAFVGYEETVTLYTWTAGPSGPPPFRIDVTLRADPLTAGMLVMVTFVSLLVAIFAAGYMHGDPGYWRFFSYISLFVFSMLMLVSVSNFLLLYVFWEAVGVCSYLLIGFWFQKPAAAAAGKKAFLVNRVGDFGFAIGVFLIWTTFGTLDFHDVTFAGAGIVPGVLGERYLTLGFPRDASLTLICLLLFAGACGKSAQFPLHVWLPDAMEGPTPVSALIHAATMVTAGVYLIARCAPLFVASELNSAAYVVAAIGTFTALLAALIALTQTDLKRILAYSTISQLGFMFLGLGTMTAAGIAAGMFHLMTHAFFKALLFLGAGSVMHAMGGVIDIRQFGGLRKRMPATHFTFLIGCLALAGFPLFSGFWSKDAILAAVYDKARGLYGTSDELVGYVYWPLWITAIATAVLTAFYTFRAFFRTFYGEERIPPEAGHHAHESPQVMTVPLGILAVFAAIAGALVLYYPEFLSRTPSLAFVSRVVATPEAAHFHWDVAALSSLAALSGIGAAAFLYLRGPAALEGLTSLMKAGYAYQLSRGKFFIDEIYHVLIVWPLRVAAAVFRFVDNFLVDGLVNLCGWLPTKIGSVLRPLQIGLVQFYALAMLLGLIVLMGSLLWWYPR